MEASKIKEQLELARRLIDGEGTPSKQIAEGARIVRCLAENDDCLEAPVWISATGRMLSMRTGRGAETTPWGVSCMTSTVAMRRVRPSGLACPRVFLFFNKLKPPSQR